MRASVCWNVERSPISGTNCFGMLSRETGHSRVPAPPHINTGIRERVMRCSARAARRMESGVAQPWRSHPPRWRTSVWPSVMWTCWINAVSSLGTCTDTSQHCRIGSPSAPVKPITGIPRARAARQAAGCWASGRRSRSRAARRPAGRARVSAARKAARNRDHCRSRSGSSCRS